MIRGARAETAWRNALAACALIAIGQIAFAFIDRDVWPGMRPLRLGHAGLCVLLCGVLVARRRSASEALSTGLFLAGGLPLFVVFWLDEAGRSASSLVWVPFVGPKLAVLGVGLLAPGLLLGLALIVAFAAEAVVLSVVYQLGGRAEAAGGEPWITLVYGVLAAGLLVHRLRREEAERAAAFAAARAQLNARLGAVSVAVRDLMNTPLQTLAINLTLLREGGPRDEREILARMERALVRLDELNRLMERYQTRESEAAALDARRILEDEANGRAG